MSLNKDEYDMLKTTHDTCLITRTQLEGIEKRVTKNEDKLESLSKWRWLNAGSSAVGIGLHGVTGHAKTAIAAVIFKLFGGQS